jgi:putative transposase
MNDSKSKADTLLARPRCRRLPKDEGDRQIATRAVEHSGPAVCGREAKPEVDRRLHLHLDRRGLLYVSAVIDLFSRRVVGWSMSAGMTAQLVADADALLMAVWRRGKPDPDASL